MILSMAENTSNIESWPCLSNGIHYKWLVDYAAYSAFGTYELSSEEWENRDLIVNFKGNSELTTEIDHQKALEKAVEMVVAFIKDNFAVMAHDLTLVCIPASQKKHTERRFKHFGEEVCAATGMNNAYDAFSYTSSVDEDGAPVDELHIDETKLKGKRILLFDDIIASGGSVAKFADLLRGMGAEVVAALALGKKISDGYGK